MPSKRRAQTTEAKGERYQAERGVPRAGVQPLLQEQRQHGGPVAVVVSWQDLGGYDQPDAAKDDVREEDRAPGQTEATRATMSRAGAGENPATAEARVNPLMPIRKGRRWPNLSPSRPPTTSRTPMASMYAVPNHLIRLSPALFKRGRYCSWSRRRVR